jgi:hypothetical protein
MLLSNTRSIHCARCAPPSSTPAQEYGDICIRRVTLFATYVLFPTSSLLLKKTERVETLIKPIKVLQSARHRAWHSFLTGDESWFCFIIDHDHIWIPDGEDVSTLPKRTASRPKRMFTVFWSPLSFSLVEILPKGIHFDASYCCSSILSTTVQN